MESGSATKEPMGDKDWMIRAPINARELPSMKPMGIVSGTIVTEVSGRADGEVIIQDKNSGKRYRVSIHELESSATPGNALKALG